MNQLQEVNHEPDDVDKEALQMKKQQEQRLKELMELQYAGETIRERNQRKMKDVMES